MVVVTIQVILKMAAETIQRALQIAVYLHTMIQARTRIGSMHTQFMLQDSADLCKKPTPMSGLR